jgi:two-component system response regulator PilR (NtrC family)
MPALRDRPADIPLIANTLLNKLCTNQQITIPSIDSDALVYISSLPFSGNVRELENMLERALALCDGEVITIDDLMVEDNIASRFMSGEFDDQADELTLTDYLENVEKKAIIQALQKTNNNKTAAAKLLGVTFRTLRYRLAKLGLSKETDTDLENDSE